MHSVIPRLVELQRVDHQVTALRAELDSFPKRVQEADAKLSSARAALASAREAQARDLAERKKIEFDVQQWRDRAKKYRDQSGAVKTNEAYKALQHEIANAEAEMAAAEDRQLAVMLAAEEGDRLVRKAEADLREAEQTVNAERKNIQSLHAQKKKHLEAALAEREKAIAPVPEEFRILYERIAKRHHGTGVAEAREGQCRGCGMRVLPHIAEQLRRDENEEIFRCESCGLILYTLEPVAPAATSPPPGAEDPVAPTSRS
jgi:predicted  nucleic acid-binding Zn-ribbon protein